MTGHSFKHRSVRHHLFHMIIHSAFEKHRIMADEILKDKNVGARNHRDWCIITTCQGQLGFYIFQVNAIAETKFNKRTYLPQIIPISFCFCEI